MKGSYLKLIVRSIRFSRINRFGVMWIIVDLALFALSFLVAFVWRYDLNIPAQQMEILRVYIVPVILVKALIFYLSGIYYLMWKYAAFRAFLNIAIANIVSSLVVVLILFFFARVPVARGVVALDGIMTLVLTVGVRATGRTMRELSSIRFWGNKIKPVLIVGAGDTGSTIIAEIQNRPELGIQVAGAIDDDPGKQGLNIRGVRVLGTRADLAKIVKRDRIEEVIICMPSVSRDIVRETYFECQRIGVNCRTLPGIYEIINGTVGFSSIKDVGVEDILGREPIKISSAETLQYISEKTVMVVGAAGWIGRELCRQISLLNPSSLILLDQNESGIYEIQNELIDRNLLFPVIQAIADITNRNRIFSILNTYKPQVIFHTAAYKHVPLMESNLIEAVQNNILGTQVLCEAAIQNEVEKFVFISTDKAVEPISVMGRTKAVTEKLIRSLSGDNNTSFTIVRFGNVLDSVGSAVRVFRQQIAHNGPVTVTHPDMYRYFMTTAEATQLVIHAGSMDGSGQIFVLDMGEQVSVLELAKTMIVLSGFEPEKDIPIKFTGIRPGEKMREKLFWHDEELESTSNKHIMKVKKSDINYQDFNKYLKQLQDGVITDDNETVKRLLQNLSVHSSTWDI